MILKTFDAENTPRLTADLIAELGFSRSTGFGLLRALVQAGWLERWDHGKIRLGRKARGLVFAPVSSVGSPVARKFTADPRRSSGPTPSPELEWNPALVNMVDTRAFRRHGPYRIGFSNASTSNPWRHAMTRSMSYARKLAGSRIGEMWIEDAEDDPLRQLAQVDDLVNRGIDLLLISVTSVKDPTVGDHLARLARDGLPIVAVDRRPSDRTSLVSFVTASDHRIGRVSALWLAEHLMGRGRVWLLSGLEGASPALRRQEAALAVFSDFPGIRVENVSYTDWTAAGGAAAIDKLLAETGRAPDGVWSDSGLQGIGSVARFLELGLDVPAHTGGDINGMYRLCLRNKVPMVALDYPASMGMRALEVALDVLSGNPVPQRVEVPVEIVLPRGCQTASVKADVWAELHTEWDLPDEAVLSQGPALRGHSLLPDAG